MKKELSSIPYYKVDSLPSKFLPYPTGTTIEYRRLTVGELKYLSSVDELTNKDTVDFLEQLTRGIDPRLLTVADSRWISILIGMVSRGIASEIGWNVRTICPQCGRPVTRFIQPNQVEFNDIQVDSLPLYITTECEKVLEIYPLTVGMLVDYDTIVAQHTEKSENEKTAKFMEDQFDSELALLALSIKSSFKNDYNLAYDFLTNEATIVDINVMSEALEMMEHNMKPIKMHCLNRECGCDFEEVMRINFQDLFRKGDNTINLRERIRTSKVPTPANKSN